MRVLDVVLLATLGPPWLLAAGLHVQLVASRGIAWVPVYVTPGRGPGAPPVLAGFWTDASSPDTALAPGDALLRVGAHDLAGAGRVAFLARTYAAWREAGEPQVAVLASRGGAPLAATLPLRPAAYPWRTVPVAIGFGLAGLVALWRGKGRRSARAFGLGALAYGFHWSLLFGAGPATTRAALVAFTLGGALFMPLLLRAALLLPERTAPRHPAARIAPWGLAVFGPLALSAVIGWPLPGALGLRGSIVANLVFLLALVAAVVRNWRRADAGGRRRLKWVVLGVALGATPVLLAAGVTAVRPDWWWLYELALVPTVLIPVCIAVAILRYGFLDIDRILSATTTYSLLSVLFLAGLLTVVPRLAARAGEATGVDVGTAQVGLSIVLAGVVVSAGRWVRPRIERVFLRERYTLAAGLARLRAELGGVEEPGAMLRLVAGRLAVLLRLERCALYARADDAFVPVEAFGPGWPPAFAASGALAALIAEAEAPVDAARWRRWIDRGLVRGAERAGMEGLGASVLVPVKRGDALEAFLCLGEKSSGDVFTAADLALLHGLADHLAVELMRFDRASIERAEREMHEALRAYVPAAVREELARGRAVEPGEREVAVLFVDVRGYTRFSESREAGEIFAAINAYTEAASAAVREHGGAVTEFHGDGLMAIFGAPAPLADKEEAAVRAALAIAERVPGLPLRDRDGRPVRLEVGVGVATGTAFVGTIQSADRRIWSCLGNPTNLAARLQALTRELDASVAIDAATWERCGRALRGEFVAHPALEVRGRSEPIDVWARPRVAEAAAAAA